MRYLIVSACLMASVTRAQAPATLPATLPAQLSADTRVALQRLLDSARAVGLPTTPLVDKAAEGVIKGADEHRIVVAVETLLHRLSDARDVVGAPASVFLLGATASALQAGVPSSDLKRLASTSSTSTDSRPFVGALVTLVDLIAKHVPRSVATASIEDLLRRRATEDQFLALRAQVAQDILGGQTPEIALAARMRAYIKTLDGSQPPRSLPSRPPLSNGPPQSL
jgi:hypothetical protein